MTALARKLQSRGYEVVFLGLPDAEPMVRSANLAFVPYCEKQYPAGFIAAAYAQAAELQGLDAVRYSAEHVHAALLRDSLEYLPEKLKEAGIEGLVLDTVHFFFGLIPMSLGMPYVHIWNILPTDLSGTSPASFLGWRHEISPEAAARNLEGLRSVGALFAPVLAVAKPFAEKEGLQVDWSAPGATLSPSAIITQIPREFDYPNIPWPPAFHYAGPFHDDQGREPVPFPWEKLTGAPLIYASLGTLLNGQKEIYNIIFEVAARLPEMQFVVPVGGNVSLEDLVTAPPNMIAVRKAPQIDLLKRAALCITHAGLNTTLECLGKGVPMVAMPIGFDQPGIAARIAYHGAGELLERSDLTVDALLKLVQKVLTVPDYREKALYFQKVIAETRGLDRAADIMEQAFRRTN